MIDDEASPIFERGDVVYGDDPFKGGEDARPWLVLSNHEGRPFHGDQYIALTLTSKSWMAGLVEVPGGELASWWYARREPDRPLGCAIDRPRGHRFLAGPSGG